MDETTLVAILAAIVFAGSKDSENNDGQTVAESVREALRILKESRVQVALESETDH